MPGIARSTRQAMLDSQFPVTGGGDYVAYSTNGTSEAASVLARTAVGATGWAAATAADPSIKANASAITSAGAGAAGKVSHFAIFSASTGGTQKTDWLPLLAAGAAAPRDLLIGDRIDWAAGALQIQM